jgi:GT2 family glycosyltransferase
LRLTEALLRSLHRVSPGGAPVGCFAVRLSVVIVAFESARALERTLPALARELQAGDELIVVDNGSGDGVGEVLARHVPDARLIANSENVGFAAAANQGVAASSGELVVVLNPDAVPAEGFGAGIRRPAERGYGWDAWMGLVTCEQGAAVNTNGGVVHFTGISWAGEAGQPVPGTLHLPRDVAFASGACLAMPRAVWERHGGFAGSFFMYHEDVDLSLRIRLAGGRVGAEPAARVDHDYQFAKGEAKWRRLEANRWATVLRTYPAPLLLLLAPALVATELAIVFAAFAGGWGPAKLAAWGDLARALPRLLRERREVQAGARIAPGAFAAWLTASLDSPYLGAAGANGLLRGALGAYWALVRLALGALRT